MVGILSPSNKIFRDGLINDAEQILAGIAEIYEVIGTTSFPALLITVDDQGIFIDHSKYLETPELVVDYVQQEMQHQDHETVARGRQACQSDSPRWEFGLSSK